MKTRFATTLVLVLCALGALVAVVSSALAADCARRPSAAVTRSMKSAVHERLCFQRNAWVSGKDRHYGLIITQVACGGSHYEHWWLHRKRLSASALWTILDERRGTIDRRAGCTRAKRVPADIRCK